MGLLWRAIKKELLSLAMIFMVFVPLMNNSNSMLPTPDALKTTLQQFGTENPADSVKGMMQGIGRAEAEQVMKILHVQKGPGSYVVSGHAPIFLTGTTY